LADLDKTKRSRRDDKLLTEREQQLAAREEELEAKFATAEQREREAVSKLALATAEREKLDERERAVKDAERELAKQRRRLQEEHAALSTVEPPPPPSEVKPQTDPEPHAWQGTPW
jgi:peptidoglycan hydrolase CwlO-like protein